MYESFYGFREKPFSLLPDPAFLYIGKKLGKTLLKLRSGVMNRAGIMLITGEIGSGKTTLTQYLIGQVKRNMTVGLINNTHSSFGNLIQWILHAFKVECNATNAVKLHQAFLTFVQGEGEQQRHTLLIVDEAQNMTAQFLEELRLLTNVNVDHQLFQVMLVGQPELRNTLRRLDMQQFAQRIAIVHHLDPLDTQETIEYIRHRLKVAGGDPALFDRQACELVHHVSLGIPRLINSLCNTALLYGYDENKTTIDSPLMNEIISDETRGELLAFGAAGGTVKRKPEVRMASEPEQMASSEGMGQLAVTRDGKLRGEYVLNGASLTIGSERDNDIVLPAPEVSAYHARIQINTGNHYLKDLGSARGVYVNSSRILGYSLQDGDAIRIGTYTLTYRNHGLSQSAEDDGLPPRGPELISAVDSRRRAHSGAVEFPDGDKRLIGEEQSKAQGTGREAVTENERDLDAALRLLSELME